MTQFTDTFKKNIIFIGLICFFTFATTSASAENSLYDTLLGKGKTCNYVDKGLYMPFSDIDETFPVFGKLMEPSTPCVDVKNDISDMFVTGFKVFLGLVSLIAVVNIAVAGIQYMTQEKDVPGRRGAKARLTNSVVGLILALSGFLILNSVNIKLTDINFDIKKSGLQEMVDRGAADVTNIAPIQGECIEGDTGCGTNTPNVEGVGAAPGTGDATGATKPTAAPTIFGYRDGNGYAGNAGDNGLGNGSWSPISGWTYYNGGAHNPAGVASAYSQGVALPRTTLVKDFGSASNVKNGAYEIFVNGKSIGAFPVVDDSATKLDLSYGLVKNHIDPSVSSSNSWSGANKNITYKPLPNYWATHPRPAQPMVRDSFSASNPSASVVDAAATNPTTFKVQ